MKKHIYVTIFTLLVMGLSVGTVRADSSLDNDGGIDKPLRPLPAPIRVENNLGTNKRNFELYTTDFNQAIKSAMPSFKEEELQKTLQIIHRKYHNGFDPVKIKSIGDFRERFALPPGEVQGDLFVGKDFVYEFDKNLGVFVFHKENTSVAPQKVDVAIKQLAEVKKQHIALLAGIGIDSSQFLFSQTELILIESEGKDERGNIVRHEALADGTLTYALRKLDGILVEDSVVKVFSKNPKVLEGLDLRWPAFRFHPQIRDLAVKSKRDLSAEILRTLKETMRKDDKINVRMAVVFKPVNLDGRLFYAPVLRVGAYSSSGDAGNLFYVNLLRQDLPIQDVERVEKAEG